MFQFTHSTLMYMFQLRKCLWIFSSVHRIMVSPNFCRALKLFTNRLSVSTLILDVNNSAQNSVFLTIAWICHWLHLASSFIYTNIFLWYKTCRGCHNKLAKSAYLGGLMRIKNEGWMMRKSTSKNHVGLLFENPILG